MTCPGEFSRGQKYLFQKPCQEFFSFISKWMLKCFFFLMDLWPLKILSGSERLFASSHFLFAGAMDEGNKTQIPRSGHCGARDLKINCLDRIIF